MDAVDAIYARRAIRDFTGAAPPRPHRNPPAIRWVSRAMAAG